MTYRHYVSVNLCHLTYTMPLQHTMIWLENPTYQLEFISSWIPFHIVEDIAVLRGDLLC